MNTNLARRFFIGLCLIGLGLFFLAGQLNLIEMDFRYLVSTYWPVVLIVMGGAGLISMGKHQGSGGWMWNLFMVLLGVGFLLRNLNIWVMDLGDYIKLLIPFFIILFGIRMIFKSDHKSSNYASNSYSYKYEYKYDGGAADAGSMPPPPPHAGAAPPPYQEYETQSHSSSWTAGENRSGFIGDLYLGQDYWELKPMNVSHFIGDTIIDLTKAQIPFGETRLNVSSFIGDVTVFVPNDIDVAFSVNSSSFLGDIKVFDRKESGFLRSMTEETQGYPYADKKIRLQCSLFIGDIHVQRVG